MGLFPCAAGFLPQELQENLAGQELDVLFKEELFGLKLCVLFGLRPYILRRSSAGDVLRGGFTREAKGRSKILSSLEP